MNHQIFYETNGQPVTSHPPVDWPVLNSLVLIFRTDHLDFGITTYLGRDNSGRLDLLHGTTTYAGVYKALVPFIDFPTGCTHAQLQATTSALTCPGPDYSSGVLFHPDAQLTLQLIATNCHAQITVTSPIRFVYKTIKKRNKPKENTMNHDADDSRRSTRRQKS